MTSTFMRYYSPQKPLFTQISDSKGFFVLRYKTLEFPSFYLTRHLAGGRESSYVGYLTLLIFLNFAIQAFLLLE